MKSLACFAFFFFISSAATAALPLAPAPALTAKAYVLKDFDSGQILVGKNYNERIESASLTKLMTAYLTFAALEQGRLQLAQPLPVSEKAWRAEGSRMFIQAGKTVAVNELLHGMIVQSGNDASIALAEGVAGSEEAFVEMMNHESQRLGLRNTHYMNATGLPHPQHYTTAYDLSLLAAAIARDFPAYYPLYSIKEYTYNHITQSNRNRLLWQDPFVDGVKTGHTETAGYCLVSSAKRGRMRLIAVVLGTASDNLRISESQKLLNYGFQFFETHRIYQKGQTVATLPVWKGGQNTLKAGLAQDLYLTLPRGQYQKVKASLISRQPLIAPIHAWQNVVGTLKLSLDGKPLAEYPLVAVENVTIANIFGRAWDSLKLMLR